MYLVGSMITIFIILFIAVFALGLPVLAGVLVYHDAKKRVDCTPWLWALVAALVPSFIGVIVYLIIRRDYPLKPVQNPYQQNYTDQQGASQSYSNGYSSGYGAEYAQDTSDTAEYQYSPADEKKEGLPTWAKALIIIVAVIVVICLIALVVSIVKAVIGYNTIYGGGSYYGGF